MASVLVLLSRFLAAVPSLRSEQDVVKNTANKVVTHAFNWTAIPATPYLNYHSCYENFECSRLEVPLDWTNRSNPYKIQLAIIRLPASVPDSDPSFGGTILVNPGGPADSGVDIVRWTGHGIREVVDGDKHFEILSWDPRGMQHTTPSVSCFSDNFQRQIWTYRNNIIGPMDAANSSLTQKWALAQSLGQACGQSTSGRFPDGSSITQYTTTSLVVKDMVEIIDQVEVLRSNSIDRSMNVQETGPALLNYWGFSYGSYLGNTFASMFPSRVGRIILDSVVDVDDYTATGWFSNLNDHERVLKFFYRDCFDAGQRCPLNAPHVTSPQDIATEVEGLLNQLKQRPVIVVHDNIPDIVTFADVTGLLLSAMYFPLYSWPELAEIMADLLNRNGTSMSKYLQTINIPDGSSKDNVGAQLRQRLNSTNAYPPSYPAQSEASHSVVCGDGDDITHLTIDDWRERLGRWRSQSSIVGWAWAENSMLCAHWPKFLRPAERNRFKGPWSSETADYDNRASPILFVGNIADPATPLRNAYKSAAMHEGARVLVQDGPGHCTGYINPTSCTWQHIRSFFAEGVLPENNTVCKRDGTAWKA